MDDLRHTHSVDLEHRLAGRRHAVHAIGALGLALMTSLGLHAPVSARKTRNKRKGKRGSAGPAGPTGPQGPAGATGASGPNYVPVYVQGQPSAPLAVTTGAAVDSIASCGTGKVLSCGYNVGATDAQMVNVIVKSFGTSQGLTNCHALLRRVTDVGSVAGATIIAFAICRP